MKNSSAPLPLRAASGGPLKGAAFVPGDKSISHRALILSAMTVGQTHILDTGRSILKPEVNTISVFVLKSKSVQDERSCN